MALAGISRLLGGLAICISLAMSAAAQSAPKTSAAPAQTQAMKDWNRSVLNHLSRIRLPQVGNYQNPAVVGYTVDRAGKVTSIWMIRRSGSIEHDNALERAMAAASPYPPPPAEVPGATVSSSITWSTRISSGVTTCLVPGTCF